MAITNQQDSAAANSPAGVAKALEGAVALPAGRGERFGGYGLMGMQFASGDVLGLRRFPHSTIGPGYTAVWHRCPARRWSFFSTAPSELSCARYTGEISDESRQAAIELAWPEPDRLRIVCDEPSLVWELRFAATPISQALNAVSQRLPARLLGQDPVLAALGPLAGALLGAGRLTLTGNMPNGQRFRLMPSHVWKVTESRAELRAEDLGAPTRTDHTAMIGDFRVPQTGLLAVGVLQLESLDPARHSLRVSRA